MPVNVNRNVTSLHASWLTVGRSMSEMGLGVGTVSEPFAGTTNAPANTGAPRSRLAVGQDAGASTFEMPRAVTVIGEVNGLWTVNQR